MSYLNTYKKRIMLNGSTELETITNDSKDFINSEFKNDPSYKLAILKKNDFEEHEVDIRVVNVDNSTSKKRIYLRPDFKVDKGDYIVYDSKTVLVEEIEENLLSPYAKVTICNQTLNCKGQLNPIPCVADNTAYGVRGVQDNGYFIEGDSRLKVLIQKNKETDRYYEGMRFIFNNKISYKITKIENIISYEIYTIEMEWTPISPLDDLENNIAHNEKLEDNPSESYEIIGVDKIKAGQTETYKIKPSRLDIVYEIDDASYATIVEQLSGECKVKALKQNGIITLSAKCGTETLDEFNIITM